MSNVTNELRRETADLDSEEFVAFVHRRFGTRVALASSMGAEDQVLTDMISRASDEARVFTLDTGRLPQETYDAIAATHRRYGIRIKLLFPDREAVEELVSEGGPNLFYDSVEARKRCCVVRKVVPLKRELATLDAWMTGLRREQAVTRSDIERVEWDEAHGLIKLNPLADWAEEQVWDYVRGHGVPYNRLHDAGYRSIGCAPCTRAVKPDEDIRAGRWWWENTGAKECGLHPAPKEATEVAQ